MKRPPHLAVLRRLNKAGVDYVLIGVLAINHYVRDPGSMYSTLDCDILIRPEADHLRKAIRVLLSEGYRLEAGGEPLISPDDLLVARLVEHRATIRGLKRDSLAIDLVLETSGFSFSDWHRGRRFFKAGGLRIPCGSLTQLLRSKEISGRPKDRAFLKLYGAQLEESETQRRRRKRRA